MAVLELNADLGEGYGTDNDMDAALLPLIDAASIACGGHAGDEASMRATLRLCRQQGVAAGAHPSYPDREHFGRRPLQLPPQHLFDSLCAQIGTLQRLAADEGVALRHVKPHGALYNQAADDASLAEQIVRAVQACAPGLALYGLAGSELTAAARRLGLRAVDEGFADRGYDAAGRLLPRGMPGALLGEQQAVAQLQRLRARVHTLCVHGDTPGALAITRALRAALSGAG